jgi:hypothetical protein
MDGTCSTRGRVEKFVHSFIDGKRPRGRPRCRWEDIRMDLTEMGLVRVYWMHVTKDKDQWWTVLNRVMNFRVP